MRPLHPLAEAPTPEAPTPEMTTPAAAASEPRPAVVRLEGVEVRRAGRVVLGPLDWVVRAGERWVVLGPNGAGKSTLVSLASARERPSAGRAWVLGDRIGRTDLRRLQPRIGVAGAGVARRFRPELSALDVVLGGFDGSLTPWWGAQTEVERTRAGALLAAAGLDGRFDQRWESLSEGERQQVLIARAFVGAPELVVLDEPAAGLDLAARERLVLRLAALAAGTPAAGRDEVGGVVLVTHHLEEIPPGFTHALLLAGGRIVAAGGITEVLVPARLAECFSISLAVEQNDGRWVARGVDPGPPEPTSGTTTPA
jgi:iron complex transport system ATP-binding protein